MTFLGRKAVVLLALVLVGLVAGWPFTEAKYSTLATMIGGLFAAFVVGHTVQQVKTKPDKDAP